MTNLIEKKNIRTNMKNLLTILIVSIAAAGCGDSETSIVESNLEVDSLRTINKSIILERDSLLKSIESLNKDITYWFNQKYDGDNFNEKGINNPKEYLWDALNKKPELIPMDAVLGGTMNYGNLEILSSEWLIVEYDDGHVIGKVIFEYHLGEKDEVTFKLIKSIENE